jgi:hypothetical protein
MLMYEKTLIKHGVIGSDFAYVVAQPLGSTPRPRLGEPPPTNEAVPLHVPFDQMLIGRFRWLKARFKTWLRQLE